MCDEAFVVCCRYYVAKKQCVNLRREATEAHCQIEKLKNLVNLLKEPIEKLEGNIPCVDLTQVQIDAPPVGSRDNLLVRAPIGRRGSANGVVTRFIVVDTFRLILKC